MRPQRRCRTTLTHDAKDLFMRQPVSILLAITAILIGTSALFYANILYKDYILAAFHKYPEPVAKKLRRALYYTNSDPQPQEALKYYKQALQNAAEVGMDPFSDEVMGIKIQVSGLMEGVGQYGKAAQVLEILRTDSLGWIEKFGGRDENKAQRTRVLAKVVGISVKLGELYSSPALYERELAEERLVWAVETVLNERARRLANRIPVDDEIEGRWMSDSEVGAALEALAHNYEEKDQHYLASPLFLQALNLSPPKTCHTVVLMNNLASSLAQQSPRAAAAAAAAQASAVISNTSSPPSAIITRETLLENATTWAHKALETAAAIAPPERTDECDVGCAVATHNLGEFAEMAGAVAEARRRYAEAVGLARAIGFQEGVDESSARLRKLIGAGD